MTSAPPPTKTQPVTEHSHTSRPPSHRSQTSESRPSVQTVHIDESAASAGSPPTSPRRQFTRRWSSLQPGEAVGIIIPDTPASERSGFRFDTRREGLWEHNTEKRHGGPADDAPVLDNPMALSSSHPESDYLTPGFKLSEPARPAPPKRYPESTMRDVSETPSIKSSSGTVSEPSASWTGTPLLIFSAGMGKPLDLNEADRRLDKESTSSLPLPSDDRKRSIRERRVLKMPYMEELQQPLPVLSIPASAKAPVAPSSLSTSGSTGKGRAPRTVSTPGRSLPRFQKSSQPQPIPEGGLQDLFPRTRNKMGYSGTPTPSSENIFTPRTPSSKDSSTRQPLVTGPSAGILSVNWEIEKTGSSAQSIYVPKTPFPTGPPSSAADIVPEFPKPERPRRRRWFSSTTSSSELSRDSGSYSTPPRSHSPSFSNLTTRAREPPRDERDDPTSASKASLPVTKNEAEKKAPKLSPGKTPPKISSPNATLPKEQPPTDDNPLAGLPLKRAFSFAQRVQSLPVRKISLDGPGRWITIPEHWFEKPIKETSKPSKGPPVSKSSPKPKKGDEVPEQSSSPEDPNPVQASSSYAAIQIHTPPDPVGHEPKDHGDQWIAPQGGKGQRNQKGQKGPPPATPLSTISASPNESSPESRKASQHDPFLIHPPARPLLVAAQRASPQRIRMSRSSSSWDQKKANIMGGVGEEERKRRDDLERKVLEWVVPEHLKGSPLCPLSEQYKGKVRSMCPYHGPPNPHSSEDSGEFQERSHAGKDWSGEDFWR